MVLDTTNNSHFYVKYVTDNQSINCSQKTEMCPPQSLRAPCFSARTEHIVFVCLIKKNDIFVLHTKCNQSKTVKNLWMHHTDKDSVFKYQDILMFSEYQRIQIRLIKSELIAFRSVLFCLNTSAYPVCYLWTDNRVQRCFQDPIREALLQVC